MRMAAGVQKSLLRKLVKVWGLDLLVPIATEPLGAHILAGDPQDVRLWFCDTHQKRVEREQHPDPL